MPRTRRSYPHGWRPSVLTSTFWGMAAGIKAQRARHGRGIGVSFKGQRSRRAPPLSADPSPRCPCKAFLYCDRHWQTLSPEQKREWQLAVKAPGKSGYDVYMKEALTLCMQQGVLPQCPSPSGGYSTRCLVPSDTPVPPPGDWIGKAATMTPPTASFEEDVHDLHPGESVKYTDTSTGLITAYHWDFGDGQESEEPSPVHAYLSPGDFEVRLDVTGPGGTSWAGALKRVAWECPYCMDRSPGVALVSIDGFTGDAAIFNYDYNAIQDESWPCALYETLTDPTRIIVVDLRGTEITVALWSEAGGMDWRVDTEEGQCVQDVDLIPFYAWGICTGQTPTAHLVT